MSTDLSYIEKLNSDLSPEEKEKVKASLLSDLGLDVNNHTLKLLDSLGVSVLRYIFQHRGDMGIPIKFFNESPVDVLSKDERTLFRSFKGYCAGESYSGGYYLHKGKVSRCLDRLHYVGAAFVINQRQVKVRCGSALLDELAAGQPDDYNSTVLILKDMVPPTKRPAWMINKLEAFIWSRIYSESELTFFCAETKKEIKSYLGDSFWHMVKSNLAFMPMNKTKSGGGNLVWTLRYSGARTLKTDKRYLEADSDEKKRILAYWERR